VSAVPASQLLRIVEVLAIALLCVGVVGLWLGLVWMPTKDEIINGPAWGLLLPIGFIAWLVNGRTLTRSIS